MKKLVIVILIVIGVGQMVTSETLMEVLCHKYQSICYENSAEWLTSPSIWYYTPIEKFKIDSINDTVFFRGGMALEGNKLNVVTIWSNHDSLIVYECPIYYERKKYSRNFKSWEDDLIRNWNIDSIKVLSNLPTGYAGGPPYIYVAEFIIKDGKISERSANYSLPGIPDEIADSATLEWRRKRAERLGHYTRF
ncbi:hypothetical protein [uncultured Duncaniella sp.]|uniref:hypothetical protein n=2 Tax=uncultured Duncaniella sp. TaxID=2768039 RepID=UPI0025F87C04|nr:hypothetical protein [uncultured Duncaniella sp.]